MGFLSKSRHETPAKRGADELAQESNIAGGVQAQDGAAESPAEEPSKDILLQVPLTEVHKVTRWELLCLPARHPIVKLWLAPSCIED